MKFVEVKGGRCGLRIVASTILSWGPWLARAVLEGSMLHITYLRAKYVRLNLCQKLPLLKQSRQEEFFSINFSSPSYHTKSNHVLTNYFPQLLFSIVKCFWGGAKIIQK
jgi:hypothetical protein